jgi:hypothetical protein
VSKFGAKNREYERCSSANLTEMVQSACKLEMLRLDHLEVLYVHT